MTIISKDQTLQFPFDTEYSLDDGSTWTALPLNTKVLISADTIDPVTKKIKVRSSSVDATTLVGMDIGINSNSFDRISINNGSLLIDASSAFLSSSIGEFNMQNIGNIENVSYILDSASVKIVSIGDMPKATNITSMIQKSAIGYIDKISAGSESAQCNGTQLAYQASIKVFGGIDLKNSYRGLYSMFGYSNIGACGHVSVHGATANDSYFSQDAFKSMKCDYMPSLEAFNLGTGTAGGLNQYFALSSDDDIYIPSQRWSSRNNTSRNVTFSSFPLDTKFAGIEVDGSSMNQNVASYYYGAEPVKHFAVIKGYYNNVVTDQVNTLNGVDDGIRFHYENNNWFPNVEPLKPIANTEFIGKSGCSTRDLVYISFETDNIDSFQKNGYGLTVPRLTSFEQSVSKVFNSTCVVLSKNNNKTASTKSGIDNSIEILDERLNSLVTIANRTLTNGSTFNNDASKLHIVTGGTVNKKGTSGQQVTNFVEVYDTVTGSLLNTISVPLGQDEYVVGIYQKDDVYGLKVIVNTWYVDIDGNYSFKESRVDSYGSYDTSLLSMSKPLGVIEPSIVMADFYESNEFNVVDTTAGIVQRIVGK